YFFIKKKFLLKLFKICKLKHTPKHSFTSPKSRVSSQPLNTPTQNIVNYSRFCINVNPTSTMLSPEYHLTLVDHITFFLLLAILAVFWAFNFYFWDHSRRLLAVGPTGETLTVILAAFSVAATCVPPVISIGIVSQVYLDGTVIWFHLIGVLAAVAITAHTYLSVFSKSCVLSSFQYIGKRFGRCLRTIVAGVVFFQYVFFLPFIAITPALIFKHVISSQMWVVVVLILIILLPPALCNSIRASSWNDFLTYVIATSIFSILIIMKITSKESISFLWNNQNEIAFKFPSTSLYTSEAHTIWNLIIGSTVIWCSFMCFNPLVMNRCLAVKRVFQSKLAIWISFVLITLIISLATICGLIAYSTFSNCDPVTKFRDFHLESVIIYLIMAEKESAYLLGPFVACMLAWTVGYLGFALYEIANLVVIEIFPSLSTNNGQASIRCSHRSCMLILLIIITGSMFVEPFGDMFMMSIQLFTCFGGPLFGLFMLGLFVPWANFQGAITGLLLSLIMSFWMTYGHLTYHPDAFASLPMSQTGCVVHNFTMENVTTAITPLESAIPVANAVFDPMYKFSYLWIGPICSGIVILIGMIVSLFTYKKTKEVDMTLLSPIVGYFVRLYRTKRQHGMEQMHDESSVTEQETPTTDDKPLHTSIEVDVHQTSELPETSTPKPSTSEPQQPQTSEPDPSTIDQQPEPSTLQPSTEPETITRQPSPIEPTSEEPEPSIPQSTNDDQTEPSTSQTTTEEQETSSQPATVQEQTPTENGLPESTETEETEIESDSTNSKL
uniref:Sodium-coupled monocarboxylate transporter 1 n=1 Tax=Strigamia maritima TaxID=126957 RepID=T1IT84_STRMM